LGLLRGRRDVGKAARRPACPRPSAGAGRDLLDRARRRALARPAGWRRRTDPSVRCSRAQLPTRCWTIKRCCGQGVGISRVATSKRECVRSSLGLPALLAAAPAQRTSVPGSHCCGDEEYETCGTGRPLPPVRARDHSNRVPLPPPQISHNMLKYRYISWLRLPLPQHMPQRSAQRFTGLAVALPVSARPLGRSKPLVGRARHPGGGCPIPIAGEWPRP
jgi:hypothetical protein